MVETNLEDEKKEMKIVDALVDSIMSEAASASAILTSEVKKLSNSAMIPVPKKFIGMNARVILNEKPIRKITMEVENEILNNEEKEDDESTKI